MCFILLLKSHDDMIATLFPLSVGVDSLFFYSRRSKIDQPGQPLA